jgi:putative intracellular protease/amidase
MSRVLMLLPARDYDPTESAVPWEALTEAGHEVRFATPDGEAAPADARLTDAGFGPLSPILMTRPDDLARYRRMAASEAHRHPMRYRDVRPSDFDGLIVPGGHASGMKSMLEAEGAKAIVREMFAQDRIVGAICHGVLLLARTKRRRDGKSVLHGRRTTALPRTLELSAWMMTAPWLGSYYRTYRETVQSEVTAALADAGHFDAGPLIPVRDSAGSPETGFVVRDGRYLSARWPGDCHRFAREYAALVADPRAS